MGEVFSSYVRRAAATREGLTAMRRGSAAGVAPTLKTRGSAEQGVCRARALANSRKWAATESSGELAAATAATA